MCLEKWNKTVKQQNSKRNRLPFYVIKEILAKLCTFIFFILNMWGSYSSENGLSCSILLVKWCLFATRLSIEDILATDVAHLYTKPVIYEDNKDCKISSQSCNPLRVVMKIFFLIFYTKQVSKFLWVEPTYICLILERYWNVRIFKVQYFIRLICVLLLPDQIKHWKYCNDLGNII